MDFHRQAIIAKDVHWHYAEGVDRAGLNGFNLRVGAGTVCGLLGPNGAGKTTAVRVLTTLLQPDSGSAHVAGYDVNRPGQQVRENIGLVGLYAAVDEVLTGKQNAESGTLRTALPPRFYRFTAGGLNAIREPVRGRRSGTFGRVPYRWRRQA